MSIQNSTNQNQITDDHFECQCQKNHATWYAIKERFLQEGIGVWRPLILSCHDSVNHARHQCVHDCMNSYDQCQTSESCSAKNASIIGIISDDKCQNSEPCSASMSKLWINVKTLNEYNALALSLPPHRMAQVPAGSFYVWKQRCTKGSAHCCLS